MTQREAKAVLLAAFRALPKRDRQRLAWHAEAGTPVLCGDYEKASLFTDGYGGA